MKKELKEIVEELSKELGCNCDLDTWEPEPDTGHSHVCRIHKQAKELYQRGNQ
ncbi:MAG: hypothetical protein KAJ07_00595 [Planctomycetes bacterium]|nr:hypothetical protein [Planctomycetota bacterium]